MEEKKYNPSVYNIGYIGEGKYKTYRVGGHTKSYKSWNRMLERCYSKNKLLKNPSYRDCSVDERWLNFQTFAKWFEENYIEGWELDKDILFKGNKVYSPETCCFVPKEINTLFTKSNNSRGNFPIGVHFCKKYKKFLSKLNGKHLGYFNTPEEAFEAYKKAKEQYIKEVANKWKYCINIQIYNMMINYKIEIID